MGEKDREAISEDIKNVKKTKSQNIWLCKKEKRKECEMKMCISASERETNRGRDTQNEQGHMRVYERLQCVETASPWQQSKGHGGSEGLA